MKKSIILHILALTALGMSGQETVTLELKIDNPLNVARKDVPVALDIAAQTPISVKSATVLVDGKQLPWQLDDLNGDDKADELAFVTDVPAKGSTKVTVTLSEAAAKAEFTPRTRAYIKLRDEKQKHPEVVSISFPGNANLLDMYNSIYGHGAVMETEPVALRIYMDNRQSVDIYSKTTPQLELDVTGFYTTREQLAQGYGCDILWAGKSVGAGSFRGYQNSTPCYVDSVSTRTQTVITDGPVRSIVEVVDKGWMVIVHPIEMVQRYTMWAGHRDVQVDVALKGQNAADVFCTGVQKLESNNIGFVNPDGLAGSWGSNVPDKGAEDLVEEVGLGVFVDKDNLKSVKEDEFNYLTLLRPGSEGKINYSIAFCGAREKGGFTGSKQWFDFLKIWQNELKAPCKVSVTDKKVSATAPFEMAPIREPIFPSRDFVITAYGAKQGDSKANTQAFAKAMKTCNKAGGGRVVVPAGEWLTGPIHFKSNVNLYLAEGAVVKFTDNPQDYLPAVMTSWEGMECYNYSPLVYAFECDNIGISGPGTLAPKMDLWRTWFKRPQPHMNALKDLYTMASTDVPVKERQMAKGENNLRPHLIHLNRCNNVLLDGFKIRESPFWTIHLYMCNDAIARNLDVKAHGHNNDGIDLEMTKNVLVENCTFDQGDDAVVIKSGRNRDAWRLNTPTENIVVRDCNILAGHVLLGIGSEISGGVRNVYMTDCNAPNKVMRMFYVKTNHRRGAFVENIYMERCTAGHADRVMEIDPEVLYQWKDLVPTYERSITRIDGLHMKECSVKSAKAIYELDGCEELPARNVSLANINVSYVSDFIGKIEHVENVSIDNVTPSDSTTVFMIGDSTMANKPLDKENQERGWGQLLPTHMQGAIKIDNHAVNGRSSLSFINEGRWDKVLSKLKKGDYVIIQFGHNDEKINRPDRYTEPGGSFDANLRRFVNETLDKGATPILMNSIVRRNFPADAEGFEKDGYDYMKYNNEGPILVDTHGAYLESPKNVARETGVTFIDMNAITHELVQGLGTLDSRELFMWIPAGKYEFCPEGKTDNTHLNIKGATVVSRLAATALADAVPALAPYIKK